MLMGGHVTTSLAEQLPVPVWKADTSQRRIARLAGRLARGSRSELLEARLDAEVAAMYGVELAEYERIVNGFPLVSPEIRELAVEELRRMGSA